MAFRSLPNRSEIMDALSYDRENGSFTWLKDTAFKRRVGTLAGCLTRYGYVMIGICGAQYFAHRLAWLIEYGCDPVFEIDHIDGNPANNAIANLRYATSSQQKQNKKVQSNNRSGLKGAYYHACRKGKKWRSQIRVNGRLHFLGYFDTAEEAHAGYAEAAREHFQDFARVA